VVGEADALGELPSICREALKNFSLPDENAGLRKQLKKVTSELFRANRQLDDLMREDVLTGVYNRGYLMNALLHSCWCSHRYGTPLSFAIFGINQLKNVSDSLGSVTGEILLREFSSTLKSRLRKTDLVGRYRAEEIGVVLTGTDGEGGMKVCEELRGLVSGGSFSGLHPEARLSTSAGLAYVDGRMSMGELLELADRSFYIARESGKEQVVAMQMSQGS
jgi:diguanylate cyclase (GGDEF)-like protein